MDRGFGFGDALYRAVSLFELGNDLYNNSNSIDLRFQIGAGPG